MAGVTPATRKHLNPVVDQAVFCRMGLSLHLPKRFLECGVIAVERRNAIPAFLANKQMLFDASQLRSREATERVKLKRVESRVGQTYVLSRHGALFRIAGAVPTRSMALGHFAADQEAMLVLMDGDY
jgi:hypothetical protein